MMMCLLSVYIKLNMLLIVLNPSFGISVLIFTRNYLDRGAMDLWTFVNIHRLCLCPD